MSDLPTIPGVEHRFVQAGALRMHVAEAGVGDPVLMLHGWPQHWYCWRRVIPRLAADHRLLCADLRGFGWSDAPRSSYQAGARRRRDRAARCPRARPRAASRP